MYLNDFCTVPMSLAGIPAISIPNGLAQPDGGGPSCRSASRSPGPAFSENRAARRAPTRSSRSSASTGARARVPELEPVIGLEIHVQLQTNTKMFCGCELSFGEPPNTRTCPVCLGLPGTLPVVNARAIHFGLMIGLALGSELAPRSIFHRKNYFYPDLPKGYQISQYDEPLCLGGRLGDVRIHRVHLEEDAAKLVHVGASGRIHGSDMSVVDFNRGGTPLVRSSPSPTSRSAEQAREWLTLLRATLRRLGVSDVNMEEGSLRCDANVSIRPAGSSELGTKTELKNMNSFRYLERGVDAEIERQRAILEAGEAVEQETLHFDPASGALTSLRSKEEAHDYRYFPEPDLVPVAITERDARRGAAAMPELPAARAERYERELGAERRQRPPARLPRRSRRLLRARSRGASTTRRHAQALANWVSGELVARIGDAGSGGVEGDAGCARGLVDLVARPRRHAERRQAGARRCSSSAAATRRRSSTSSTCARWATAATSSPDRGRRRSRRTPTRWRRSAAAT